MSDGHTDELRHEDGQAHCPNCEWWVPEGMEYLYPNHRVECAIGVGDYHIRCACGDVASRDTLETAREWADEHAAMCEHLSNRERDVTIFEVVDHA